MQSEHIRERINQFGNKLYMEFGGKLFDDYHASRVLHGFAPDSKLRMLMQLSDQAEIVIVISAGDIEKNKVRGDLGITYATDVLRLIDVFKDRGSRMVMVSGRTMFLISSSFFSGAGAGFAVWGLLFFWFFTVLFPLDTFFFSSRSNLSSPLFFLLRSLLRSVRVLDSLVSGLLSIGAFGMEAPPLWPPLLSPFCGRLSPS